LIISILKLLVKNSQEGKKRQNKENFISTKNISGWAPEIFLLL